MSMRDISSKSDTLRTAMARATLKAAPSTVARIKAGDLPKGDPLPVAKVAAIQAAKQTSSIIPYCHPLPVAFADCRFSFTDDSVEITTEVKALYKTGVEMEALTAATVAALTVYDMAKQIDDALEITGVTLVRKTGGKSDFARKAPRTLRAAVVVVSDSVFQKKKEDGSGMAMKARLEAAGVTVPEYAVVPDEVGQITSTLTRLADASGVDFIFTTGGTGLSPRDVTPEATRKVIDRPADSITEALRGHGQHRLPMAMLSRATAGIRKSTLIVNLPGSVRGVEESLDLLLPILPHAVLMMGGGGHEVPPA